MTKDLLHTPMTPKAQPVFENLPAGKYLAKVKDIADWKGKEKPQEKVWLYDADFKKVKDANGKDEFSVENITSYSAEITYEILEPVAFAGRTIKSWLILHPNMPWSVPSFLDACAVLEDVEPAEIAEYCIGADVVLDVEIETKDREKTNPQTGVTETISTPRNNVKRISLPELPF